MPEVIACPECQKTLRVPDDLLGRKVKCPTCGTTFKAEVAGKGPAAEEDRPAARSSSVTPRGEDDRPLRRSRVDDEDDEEEVRPRRRSSRDDEDDEDDDDRPRRRRSRGRRANYTPHRGVLILVLAIMGFVICPILYPVAWIMGNNDLKEIDAGRMDPEGRGLTTAGRIIGMIGSILSLVGFVLICVFYLFVAVVAVSQQ